MVVISLSKSSDSSSIPMENERKKIKLSSNASQRLSQVANSGIADEDALVSVARSVSSAKNTKRAAPLLKEFASKLNMNDPQSVSPGTSKMVLNFIYTYCKTGTDSPLSIDSFNALVQGLRNVYNANGHRGYWRVDSRDHTASGNPLEGNDDLAKLRISHKVYLSRLGRSKKRARALPIALVCEHALRFWFCCGNSIDNRDVLIHAVLLLGLNFGLRHDEVNKMKIENVSVMPGMDGTGSILLFIPVSIKNSTKGREYIVRNWPGNSKLRNSIITDPFVALLSWMKLRGNRPGYLFCHVNKKNMMDVNRQWSTHDFTTFFRLRLRMCGVGAGVVDLYSAHSLKRGCVQLYRSLGLRDENIMEIIQMTGPNAYTNYCAAYNDCAPSSLPRFNNYEDFIKHAQTLIEEERVRKSHSEHFEYEIVVC